MSAGNLRDAVETQPVKERGGSRDRVKISVCHIASGDRWAGAEAQIAALVRGLASREDFSVCAILLNEGRLARELCDAGVAVRVLPETTKGFVRILSEAAKFLRGRGIRVLHSHRYKENLLATLLAWRCHVPWVVRTQHGAPEPFTGWKKGKHAFVQGLDRLTARYGADRVISVSAEMRGHLARGKNGGKFITIPNGLETERVRSRYEVEEAKSRLGLPGDAPVIGTAGRLEPVKRLDIFLAAAEQLAARLPEARFVIAGAGAEEARLRHFAEASRLRGRTLFLGHRDDIYDVLRAMDVFALTSDHEGLPTVLLEALWLGVPVVARAVGGVPEVIEDEVSGVLVQSAEPTALAEACWSLLHDAPRRRRLAAAGVEVVREKFTARRTVTQVAQLYASLCGGP